MSEIFLTSLHDVFWIFLESPEKNHANTLVIPNNRMHIIHAIRTLRIVCGFLDMGDGCYSIFNKKSTYVCCQKINKCSDKEKNHFVLFVTNKSHLVKPLSVPSKPQVVWYKTVRRYRSLRTEKTENSGLRTQDFLSFVCLILIWCVCMIFCKISLVTSHGAFSTRFDFTAGNTPCRKTNQSTTSIHSVPSVLVFRTALVENTRLKCLGDVSLGNECKYELQTHTQESLYDTYFKHGIGWHTTQYRKGYCQRYDDFQGNDGHFIGDWLNIVYRYFSNTPRKFSCFPNESSVNSFNCSYLFYSVLNFLPTAFQHHSLPGNGMPRYRPVNCVRLSQELRYHVR